MTRREFIAKEIDRISEDFLYQHRRGDKNLPVFSIEDAIIAGEVTSDEIVAWFKQQIDLSVIETEKEYHGN